MYAPPGKVARFGERSHLLRSSRKLAQSRPKFTPEKVGERPEYLRLEFRHIDPVLCNEGLDLARAPGAVLVGRNEPVIKASRRQPLGEGPPGAAIVGGWLVVHELLQQPTVSAVPNR